MTFGKYGLLQNMNKALQQRQKDKNFKSTMIKGSQKKRMMTWRLILLMQWWQSYDDENPRKVNGKQMHLIQK